jgi:hypothetical protein
MSQTIAVQWDGTEQSRHATGADWLITFPAYAMGIFFRINAKWLLDFRPGSSLFMAISTVSNLRVTYTERSFSDSPPGCFRRREQSRFARTIPIFLLVTAIANWLADPVAKSAAIPAKSLQ